MFVARESLGLGIDTGGTYTDAVLVRADDGEVLASAKALTTRHDLSVGIANAIDAVGPFDPTRIRLVSLATTLATNASVEGIGGSVCLILIGYDAAMLHKYGLDRQFHASAICHVRGRHDVFGVEVEPLDEEELITAIGAHAATVDAIAISSYLSVRNPDHEQRAFLIAKKLTYQPVVLGGELSGSLNSVWRAATAALNARLIPVIKGLIEAVESATRARGIAAPLAIVRGDGSLMSASFARERPIETVLSGPAASVTGAQRLTGLRDGVVVDMGGTTTDIAVLRDGRPEVTEHGAEIGGWRTAVRAVNTQTAGLGGDSRIVCDPLDFFVGPRRVVPLALAAREFPQVAERLRQLDRKSATHRLLPVWEFIMRGRVPERDTLSDPEVRTLQLVADGPVNILDLASNLGLSDARLLDVSSLESRGLVVRVGLTPTDILHVRGEFEAFDREAAESGTRIAAREGRMSPEELAARVHEHVVRHIAMLVLRKCIGEVNADVANDEGPLGTFLLEHSTSLVEAANPIRIRLDVTVPIIAIGAPAHAWLPEVARRLRAEYIIPEHAAVASAIGAILGTVTEVIEILLRPQYARRGVTGFTIHSPRERVHFASKAAARDYALQTGPQIARDKATLAGADSVEVSTEETSWDALNEDPDGGAYLMETRFRFTAIGRPRL